jgi:hypothetical protein
MLIWPLHFRKSPVNSTDAELVVHPEASKWLTASWVGASVPVRMDGVVPKPSWVPLVSEVRRLGGQQR